MIPSAPTSSPTICPMAHIVPDGWRELSRSGAAQREIETLALLETGLPAGYTVYHAVHWTNIERGFAMYGEIDFIVVNRAGDLLMIEQKSGFLDETADGLAKRYGGRSKRVAVQMARSRDGLLGKLHARPGCAAVQLDALLYCPDYRVRNPLTAGLAPERVVDAANRERLVSIIRAILAEGEEQAQARPVHQFLRDIVQLEADVSALLGQAREMVTRISGGLAHWARQLDFSPYRLRVSGTAGSGKTQLALAEYRAACAEGKRPLYVCFNRPLADHFSAIAPAGGLACTFHTLCEQALRAAGAVPDFTRPDAFERLVAEAAQRPVAEALRFDAVIVDEGQDFPEVWRDQVLRHARPDARLLWLEDPMQNLYARPPVALPGWVGLHASANYRCPRSVVKLLNALQDDGATMEAASPFAGSEVEFLTYRTAEEMLQQVKEAVRQCYSAGFRKGDVALLSYRGRDNSQLLQRERLGANLLKTFSGRYDLLGQPIYAEGDLLTESVYRFKGQAAPAVILAEVDFAELDDKARRKLFVGASRAMMKLVLVVEEKAAAALLQRLP